MFPLKNYKYQLPISGPASFGAIRKFNIHEGIDLYCEPNEPVFAIENGIVINVEEFTGPKVGSPWWNETWSVLVESKEHIICYGEIKTSLKTGDKVFEGDLIGNVVTVLKKDKGKNPTSMLHIEMYKLGTKHSITWELNKPQPNNLLDVTQLLIKEIK